MLYLCFNSRFFLDFTCHYFLLFFFPFKPLLLLDPHHLLSVICPSFAYPSFVSTIVNAMNSLKLTTLHNLALHCGYPTLTTKASRLAIADAYRPLLNMFSFPLNVLSIDVGIKNFSYCKLRYSGRNHKVTIADWNYVNLHDRFGDGYSPITAGSVSAVDSKAYLAHLALSVVDNVLACPKWTPNVITIENQRTRSNSNSSTLPNVLLNFTLEHMIYAAFAARKSDSTRLSQTVIMPMNSNKMVNFWLTRFLAKTKLTAAQSKLLRTNLLYGWLSNPELAPFPLPIGLEQNFGSLSSRAKTAAFLDLLSLDSRPTKVDDLVDCILYNMAFAKQLEHHLELEKARAEHNDISELTARWDKEHCVYLTPLIASGKMSLNDAYRT